MTKVLAVRFLVMSVWLLLCASSLIKAQKPSDRPLPEMNGGLSQVFKDIQYEIVDIKRVAEYQDQFSRYGRNVGKKWIAGPNEDIAIVRIHVKRFGENSGFSLMSMAIQDFNGEMYPGTMTCFLGVRGKESETNPKDDDIELPVEVPKLGQFASLRLILLVPVEEEQRVAVQKITFNISALK